jgi:hypothetical protein
MMKDEMSKRYKTKDGYMQVIGYIDKPAIILKDHVTGHQKVIVVGSMVHQSLEEISDADALNFLEAKVQKYDES